MLIQGILQQSATKTDANSYIYRHQPATDPDTKKPAWKGRHIENEKKLHYTAQYRVQNHPI
ncbi:hypothetical protein DN068_17050 [Taibaiella soli]|uniref:Uncharacterized protein n=1 Tax=Taibaiella soli TaxID=1649169 RepID=A0A2W2AE01_9BACT|nr:hypothetical protein DN068_17050 [Taibaiella soli]